MKLIVEESIDASITSRLFNPTPGAPLVELENVKRNFFFFTDYTFSLHPPSLMDQDKTFHIDFPVDFVLSFPGSVQSTNAGKIENGKAIWTLEKGDQPVLKLSSRKINMLNIFALAALLVFALARVTRKLFIPKTEEQKPKPKT